MAEVRDLFIGEVTQAVPNLDIDHEWFKKQARDLAKSSVAPASPASSRLTTIQDLQDAEWQAREAGVVVGRMYFEKGVGPSSGIYKLVSITAAHVGAADVVRQDHGVERACRGEDRHGHLALDLAGEAADVATG